MSGSSNFIALAWAACAAEGFVRGIQDPFMGRPPLA
jgi:hypothetical protein